jgi:hypothetical protein
VRPASMAAKNTAVLKAELKLGCSFDTSSYERQIS